ncbi:flavin reductase family protein [Sphingomonas canadensis]|uniref:Flavin reductase family protein n=1 Tax=Sphingomonas canadensis TaxID=1219257 RepID=A0ABW3H782_9SPHN|nr:flavin reductase family protein [Sphingomonas canadensis]MCW3837000.1 flavin reductase family protein [Sphingomonas canadensis]
MSALAQAAAPCDADRIPGDLFRRVLGNVPTSVAIVAGMDAEGPFGVVIGSLVSISLDPPLVGLFVDNGSRTLPRLLASGWLSINVLAADQEGYCREFGRNVEARFQCGNWTPGCGAAPRLGSAIAWIEGRVERAAAIGDHRLIVVEARAMQQNPDRADDGPLVFFRGGFGL